MRLICTCLFVVSSGLLSVARGQSSVPTVSQPVAAQNLAVGATAVSIDLRNVFTIPGVTGPLVQFDTVLGKFNVELRPDAAPGHVANFQAYVRGGYYANSFMHRAVPFTNASNAIVQGGGYAFVTSATEVPKFAPIALEYNLPNERGTIAAARLPELNSATSEWFFNVQDNTTTLGPGNGGGYSVFGRVIGSGMTVVDAMAGLPTVNAGSPFNNLPVRNYNGEQTITSAHLVMVSSTNEVTVYPTDAEDVSVLAFSAESSAPSIASVAISGSGLAITPRGTGSANVTVRATDTNGNVAENVVSVTVAAGPTFSLQPSSQVAAVGGSITLRADATGAIAYQWRRNGVDIAGATGADYTINSVAPTHAGTYVAVASNGAVTSTSAPAIINVSSTEKVAGTGDLLAARIPHPNGNLYDQVLLTGAAATVRTDPGVVVRTSFIDESDDIVQVEFGGAGSLTILVDNLSGPAVPTKYSQDVNYVKGRASLVLTGADASTYLSVFSVGRVTAVNQALFRSDETYDAMADIASVAITSADGHFGSLLTANTRYSSTQGLTGVYAPGVNIDGTAAVDTDGRVFVGDISASDQATPTLIFASAERALVTGGDIFQPNARAVQITGLSQLQMSAGTDSHGAQQVAQMSEGRLEREGEDVTASVVQQPE